LDDIQIRAYKKEAGLPPKSEERRKHAQWQRKFDKFEKDTTHDSEHLEMIHEGTKRTYKFLADIIEEKDKLYLAEQEHNSSSSKSEEFEPNRTDSRK
jgi:hypothetical protein